MYLRRTSTTTVTSTCSSASSLDDKIAWYENDGNESFTAHTISTAADGAASVFAADVDADGHMDLLSASRDDDKIAWYENDGSENFTVHTISTTADGARSVFGADVDGDGDLDVHSASPTDDKIAWYENDGSENFTTHTISTAADGARSVFAVDVDGDGDTDVLSASADDDRVAWYENDGSESFTLRTISIAADTAQGVFAADVDGDGDLDVLSASESNDRITWYENLRVDFGDAPVPYPTLFAENGARHLATGLTLGLTRDIETHGTHSAGADADGADEDGVTFASVAAGALDVAVTVNVQGGSGQLDAWIDFNSDGNWGGPDEQVFNNVSVSSGDNVLMFDVPSWATAGNTYARFRLSTSGNLTQGGPAQDGEVEDYQVTINPPATATGSFYPNAISTVADTARDVFAADVDGDGDTDVLAAALNDDRVAWYENVGNAVFTTRTISTTADGVNSVFATDVDRDGDIDILSASFYDDKIAWYENDGSQNFSLHTISTSADGALSVYAADVDGDEDTDVLSASRDDDKIAWYENDGSENFTTHTISVVADAADYVIAADVNGDGHMDVLSASTNDDKVAWYKNDGSENFTTRTLNASADGAFSVFASDVDGDGDTDVLSASRLDDALVWYEHDGSENFIAHTISTADDGVQSVVTADINGDGDTDIISGAVLSNRIKWYENDGSENFTSHTISTDVYSLQRIFAADVDGDGDIDVLSASQLDDKIAWYDNDPLNDFGDAPFPYPTTRVELGAHHLATSLTLGATIDTETENGHSAAADSDGSDEDGVTFGTIAVGAVDAAVTVNVQGAAAKLDAWIDFNGDGNWGGAGEQIFDSVSVSTGDNVLLFDVPSWAISGDTYARFRLSTAGDLGVAGTAADGEVEDYQVAITRPAPATALFVAEHTISTSADGAYSVFAADVDGDGDTDVLSASIVDGNIAWYENDGSEIFTFRTITSSSAAHQIFAADVDGDGDTDVLAAYLAGAVIHWYENDGSENFTPRPIYEDGSWGGPSSLIPADVDGDGDFDVLSASYRYSPYTYNYEHKVLWHENDGSEVFTDHTISTGAGQARSVVAFDVDGDGDLDAVSASYAYNSYTYSFEDTLKWYQNDGSENFTEHTNSILPFPTRDLFAADVDGDGAIDLLSASVALNIAWHQNSGGLFSYVPISTTTAFATSVFATDVDGDGDIDVLGATADNDQIILYTNDSFENFTAQTITTSADGATSVFAADVDGDGDLDVLSASLTDDKIAWYENPPAGTDFGDAPVPYPTTLAEDGARHTAVGLTLGPTRDTEADGSHSAGADADGADEDGVTFGAIDVGALDATLTVNMSGADGRLDAWIDFNADGSWGGPGEQVFDNVSLVPGDNVLTFDVPSWASDGNTYARFRLSTVGDLGVGGLAIDGEVEDYQITINPPTAVIPAFNSSPINTTADGAEGVFAADVDRDGDTDVLSASALDNKIAWYENDGGQNFTVHTISTAADGARSVFAMDVDGDGDNDVLSASATDDKIAWYENDGSENFAVRTISTAAGGAESVFAADVDDDGDMDVLSASATDDKIAWYENDGSENFTARTISTSANGAESVFAADVDDDGDMDVLSASATDDKIAWYKNDGSENFTTHTVSTAANNARSVFAADVDGNGDMDVLSASIDDDKIAWYENDGNENFTTRTISTVADEARSVLVADMNGDGDLDVLSASAYDDKIAWYENDGNESFTLHVVSTDADSPHGVFVADVDGDGDLDILSASALDDKIAWYENDPAFDYGDAPLPYPTTFSENGARHPAIGPRLGALRDTEADGSHSAAADSDGADEDGVTFGAIIVGALDATVIVNVQIAAGKLDGWIDFNGDGSWGGPGEQVFDNVSVTMGNNALTYDVPIWAADGNTYARFRLSTAGDLGISGAAADGEVEDYQVTINPPAVVNPLLISRPINTAADGARSVFAADVDGDGDVDVLSGSYGDNKIAWYENDGSESFMAHTISTGAGYGALSVFAVDLDGDGDIDVLSGSYDYYGSEITWYENNGSANFTTRSISTTGYSADSVFAADVDGDGDIDVLSASNLDGSFSWYENNGSESFTPHLIAGGNGVQSVFAADVDGDGDIDVLGASTGPPGGGSIGWFENDGSENFTIHGISPAGGNGRSVFAADVDGDGHTDVLSVAGGSIAWFENDGSENFTTRTISTAASGAASVFAADVNGDGDTDVLSASALDDKIAWYENDGTANFTLHTISTSADGAFSVFAADVDGDGDTDIISASLLDNKIAWYENQPAPEAAVWYGDGVVGTAGDGINWSDPNNWTVAGVNDKLPAVGPPGDNVTFVSAPTIGSIDLGTNRTINTATFQAGYALTNHTLTITTGQIDVDPSVEATIASDLASGVPAGILKQGSGTLVITGAAPDVVLNVGTLEVTSTASINTLTINGGTAYLTGSITGGLINNGGRLIIGAPGSFVMSGQVTAADVDMLYSQVPGVVPAVHARFDLVPDGIIDGQDVDRLIHGLLQREFGDADLDGDVDITDANTLVEGFDPQGHNLHNGWAQGNFDGDDDIDIFDFNYIAANFAPTGYVLQDIESSAPRNNKAVLPAALSHKDQHVPLRLAQPGAEQAFNNSFREQRFDAESNPPLHESVKERIRDRLATVVGGVPSLDILDSHEGALRDAYSEATNSDFSDGDSSTENRVQSQDISEIDVVDEIFADDIESLRDLKTFS